MFDHLGYGQSEMREGQDLSLAAQGRNFAELLHRWELDRPSVVACDIGGAIALRALLLEGAAYSDLTLFDAVTGGDWERGLFALIRKHHAVFEQLPAYAHEALVSAYLRNGTKQGYRPGVLETYLAPWLGSAGQAAVYRQYRRLSQADTAEYEHLLDTIDIPVSLLGLVASRGTRGQDLVVATPEIQVSPRFVTRMPLLSCLSSYSDPVPGPASPCSMVNIAAAARLRTPIRS